MATAAAIQQVRRLINDPEHDEFSDEDIANLLDGVDGDVNRAVAGAWGIKAGLYSTLVNTSEAGSSRSLGDLYKNALQMQAHYNSLSTSSAISRTRIGRIVRSDS